MWGVRQNAETIDGGPQLEIEQILERVRGQALGMRRSEDLAGVATTELSELGSLDLPVWRCGFGVFHSRDGLKGLMAHLMEERCLTFPEWRERRPEGLRRV